MKRRYNNGYVLLKFPLNDKWAIFIKHCITQVCFSRDASKNKWNAKIIPYKTDFQYPICLVVRIPGSHPGGPDSIPGMGSKRLCNFNSIIFAQIKVLKMCGRRIWLKLQLWLLGINYFNSDLAWIDSHHYYLRPMSLILDYRSIGIELYRFGFERFLVKLRIEIRYFILA